MKQKKILCLQMKNQIFVEEMKILIHKIFKRVKKKKEKI
jgi:hypothetical protein